MIAPCASTVVHAANAEASTTKRERIFLSFFFLFAVKKK